MNLNLFILKQSILEKRATRQAAAEEVQQRVNAKKAGKQNFSLAISSDEQVCQAAAIEALFIEIAPGEKPEMRPCRSEGEGDERREMKEERGMVKKK